MRDDSLPYAPGNDLALNCACADVVRLEQQFEVREGSVGPADAI